MTDPAPIIRQATLADLEAVIQVRVAAILALAPDRTSPDKAASWAHRPDRPARCRLSIERGQISVADVDGVAVGWVEVHGDFVAGLYVAPDRWRNGLGSKLMAFAEDLIREKYAEARLRTASPTVCFYGRLGYRATGRCEAGPGTPMAKTLRGDRTGRSG